MISQWIDSIENCVQKMRGIALGDRVGKKNIINLHSAAFVTAFARNLVHAYKFRIIQKIARHFFL